MKENGISQWDYTYPNKQVVQKDLREQNLYKWEIEGKIAGIIT